MFVYRRVSDLLTGINAVSGAAQDDFAASSQRKAGLAQQAAGQRLALEVFKGRKFFSHQKGRKNSTVD